MSKKLLRRQPSWNPIWLTWWVLENDSIGFLDPENIGVEPRMVFLAVLVKELLVILGYIWRPFWNSIWRPPGGVNWWCPFLILIYWPYRRFLPSFMLSSKNARFWWKFDLSRCTNASFHIFNRVYTNFKSKHTALTSTTVTIRQHREKKSILLRIWMFVGLDRG